MNGLPFAPSATQVAAKVLREIHELDQSLSEANIVASDVNAFKYFIRKSVWKQWAEEWTSALDSAQTRELLPTPSHARFLHNAFLYHENSQLVKGHSALNHHLYKIGRSTSSMCVCGEEEETRTHYLFRCPRFSQERRFLHKSITDAGVPFPLALNIFAEIPALFKEFMKFVRTTNRLAYDKPS